MPVSWKLRIPFRIILLYCIVGFAFITPLAGQVLNNGFEEWDSIVTSDANIVLYNPLDWKHFNSYNPPFYVSMPVGRTSDAEEGEYAVFLEPTSLGINELYPGTIKQTVSLRDVKQIKYNYKCELLSGRGACLFEVLRSDNANTIISDTISTENVEFEKRTYSIDSNIILGLDSIQLVFHALGGNYINSELNGHSRFTIDNVQLIKTTSLSDSEVSNIWPYPNPFTHSFYIDNKNSEFVSLSVYNLDGRLTYKQELIGGRNKVSCPELNSGFHFMKLFDKAGSVHYRRIYKY